MGANAETENRVLNVSELAIVSTTRSPAIEQLSTVQLQALVRRLRQAHCRVKVRAPIDCDH